MPGKNQNNERNRIFRVEEDNFAIIEAKVQYYSDRHIEIKEIEQGVKRYKNAIEETRRILDELGAYRSEQSRKIYAEKIKDKDGLETEYHSRLERLKRLKTDVLRKLDGESATLFENDSVSEIYSALSADVANYQQQANFAAV